MCTCDLCRIRKAKRLQSTYWDNHSNVCEFRKAILALKERREQKERDRSIKFLAFVGKVASFMQILATQIKDEVRQIREITLDAEGGVHYKDLED